MTSPAALATIPEIDRELARLRCTDESGAPFQRTSVMTHLAWVPGEWVEMAEDVLAGLGLDTSSPVARGVPSLPAQEATIVEALSAEPRHVDQLARELAQGVGEISAALAVLELRGLVRQIGAMVYARA